MRLIAKLEIFIGHKGNIISHKSSGKPNNDQRPCVPIF